MSDKLVCSLLSLLPYQKDRGVEVIDGHADHGAWSGKLKVEVYVDNNKLLTSGSAKINSLGNLISFNTTSLQAQKTPYNWPNLLRQLDSGLPPTEPLWREHGEGG